MISYQPLWRTLAEKRIELKDLAKGGLHNRTINKFRGGKDQASQITTETIDRICSFLDCRVEDVIEHIQEKEK